MDDITTRLRSAVSDGTLLDEAADHIDAERALTDDAIALLVEARFAGHPKELIALEDRRDAVMARYQEARQQ